MIERVVYRTVVPPEWIDFNGHMRDAYYVLAVSYANDAIVQALGLGPAYLAETGCTVYNLESHTRFLKEGHAGDRIGVDIRLLDADAKRLHLFSEVRRVDGELLALNEELLLHVSRGGARPAAAPFPPDVQARVDARQAEDAARPAPELRAGPIGLRRARA
jgi:acyl-CoA thioester hydrolase